MSKLQKAKDLASRNKTLISNFGYLGILQALNLVLPLVTYPYLIRILGLDLFGKVIFAQTIGFYAAVLINYGFNITATRKVAKHRADPVKLSEIVNAVLGSKSILWIASLLIITGLIFSIPYLKDDKLLFFLSFLITFNELLVPVWFFQGIEKMKYLTLVNFISRSLSVILVFILVKAESDYYFVPALLGLGALVGGIISLYLVYKKEKVVFKVPRGIQIKAELVEGFPVFLSRLAAMITERTNIILLGTFGSMSMVTIYDFIIKVLSFFKIPIEILVRTVYPRISLNQNKRLARRTVYLSLSWGLLGGLIAIVSAPLIIQLVGPEQFDEYGNYLYFILPMLLLISLSWSLGQPFLLAFGYIKLASKITIGGNLVYMTGALILALNNAITVVNCLYLFLIVESVSIGMRYYFVRKKKIWAWNSI